MSGTLSEGKILSIDRKGIYDPKLKYEVEFDEFNIITFFTEEAISNWIDKMGGKRNDRISSYYDFGRRKDIEE